MDFNDELSKATWSGDTERIKQLIKNGVDEENLNSLMLIAVIKGHEEIVKVFLEAGVDVSKKPSEALTVAAMKGHKEIVKLLIEKGADIHEWDDWAVTSAARHGHAEVVEILLKAGAKMEKGVKDFVIQNAWAKGYNDIVKLLQTVET